ncbi:Exodeoxyribonuclease VII small subunit [Frigoriglobus tundricola]|uniref:Exodeoxyribonuclease 7 small subunit n=2 Tax=Frigoriglobus tundricola TaxID=2774151 RepID=A0A6M5YVI5_9BACT|nr:Exodeoxyribonuclease VII small subunit [Frigoriglobus tundricola]
MDGLFARTGCAPMPDPSDLAPPRFEQALAELDDILRELEDGTTTLEDALARYERGVVLLRQCYGQLRDAEQRVKVLAGVSEDGADLKPFDHVASIESAKAAVRKPTKAAEPGADPPRGFPRQPPSGSGAEPPRGFPRQPPPDSGITE